jgi:hypothetical protein
MAYKLHQFSAKIHQKAPDNNHKRQASLARRAALSPRLRLEVLLPIRLAELGAIADRIGDKRPTAGQLRQIRSRTNRVLSVLERLDADIGAMVQFFGARWWRFLDLANQAFDRPTPPSPPGGVKLVAIVIDCRAAIRHAKPEATTGPPRRSKRQSPRLEPGARPKPNFTTTPRHYPDSPPGATPPGECWEFRDHRSQAEVEAEAPIARCDRAHGSAISTAPRAKPAPARPWRLDPCPASDRRPGP